MEKINDQALIGYFLKRNDICNISVSDLQRELQSNLFEANIIKLAIEHFQEKKMFSFDCAVGDWKCQTRTSMIVDLMEDSVFLDQELSQELIKINNLFVKTQGFCNKIQQFNVAECQLLRKELKEFSLQHYLRKNQLNYEVSKKIMLLSLCFLTTTRNNVLPFFAQYQISVNKMKALINIAKKTLCFLSINYEKKLAQIYNMTDQESALRQIESKEAQSMIALFPGFQCIFKKMQAKEQSFVTDNRLFCVCGGILDVQLTFFTPKNNKFIPIATLPDLREVITVINTYQFPGSLDHLQTLLSVPGHELGIPNQYYKSCKCVNPTQQQKIDSIEQAIMAFFAQHPQFTNGAQIDFEGLGLLGFNLKKEYDYLLTLQGFSRDDMSKFQIIHMYPATVEQVLQEQEAVQTSLKHSSKVSHSSNVPGVSKPDLALI